MSVSPCSIVFKLSLQNEWRELKEYVNNYKNLIIDNYKTIALYFFFTSHIVTSVPQVMRYKTNGMSYIKE